MDISVEILKAVERFPEGFKETLGSTVDLIIKNDPSIDIKKILGKVDSLDFLRSKDIRNKKLFDYNPNDNTIYVKKELIEDEKLDHNYLMTKELLSLTYHETPNEFIRTTPYMGIYKGWDSIVANNLVGNNSEVNFHEDEQVAVNLIGCILDPALAYDVFTEMHQTNNPLILIRALKEKGYEERTIKILLDKISQNYYSRYNGLPSSLANIQILLTEMFFQKENLSNEFIEQFGSHLISNPEVFENPQKYKGLQESYSYFTSAALSYLEPKSIDKKRSK